MTIGRGRDWRSIVLAVVAAGGALMALVASLGILLFATYQTLTTAASASGVDPDPLQAAILATALGLIGLVAGLTAYHAFQYWRLGATTVFTPGSLPVWRAALLIALWLCSALVAQLFFKQSVVRWFTPLLYAASIGIPVFFVLHLALGNLPLGSPGRFLGLMTTGMFLGTGVAVMVETLVAIVGVLAAIGYLAFHPEQMAALQDIATQLARNPNPETVTRIVTPVLAHPLALSIALLFFAGLTPIIEEGAKSLAVWSIFDRLRTPTQGYVAGALSGAGFGLLESLMASASPDASWSVTLLVRGGSSMMHIAAAALAGWGIAAFRVQKAPRRMLVGYGLAILIHGLWNASVVTLGFGGLRLGSNVGGADRVDLALVILAATTLAILCLAIPIALPLIGRTLKRGAIVQVFPLAAVPDVSAAHSKDPSASEQG